MGTTYHTIAVGNVEVGYAKKRADHQPTAPLGFSSDPLTLILEYRLLENRTCFG
jgi:hypothetical protein